MAPDPRLSPARVSTPAGCPQSTVSMMIVYCAVEPDDAPAPSSIISVRTREWSQRDAGQDDATSFYNVSYIHSVRQMWKYRCLQRAQHHICSAYHYSITWRSSYINIRFISKPFLLLLPCFSPSKSSSALLSGNNKVAVGVPVCKWRWMWKMSTNCVWAAQCDVEDHSPLCSDQPAEEKILCGSSCSPLTIPFKASDK